MALVASTGLAAPEAPYPAESRTKVSAESLGWSEPALKNADDFARSIRSTAYMVVHRGVIVHEFGETHRTKAMEVLSMRKSLLSILVGIHADRGEIDLAKTLAQLGIDDKQGLSDAERAATVRQLLQARSGVYHPAAYESEWAKRERPARGSHKPGAHFY